MEWKAPKRMDEGLEDVLPHALNLGKFAAMRSSKAAYIAKHQGHSDQVRLLLEQGAYFQAIGVELMEKAYELRQKEKEYGTSV